MTRDHQKKRLRKGGAALLITRETDYALRILRALSEGELLTAGDISEKEGVPQQFAYKILKKLEKADLVQIVRGAGGGCRLAAKLEGVTLFDLMGVMDEDISVISCMEPGFPCTSPHSEGKRCPAHQRLCLVQAALDRELKSHTLKELLCG